MDIKCTYTLDENQSDMLECLIKECDGYEPFLDLDFPYYMAYNHGIMIGFLSYIIVNGEAEITALVLPSHRHQHVFSSLLKEALNNESLSMCQSIVGAFSDELKDASLCRHFAYKESLYTLTNNNAVSNPCDTSIYEMCYLRDEGLYLMFDDSSDEAIGSLSLSFDSSSTCIYDVEIQPERRGCGLGSIMINSFVYEYFNNESAPLILNVRSTNVAAVALYKKCGFTEVSHINYYYIVS